MYDGLRMGLQALVAHKLRSLLTTLGIVIGVSTVIALLTLIQGIDRYMAEELGELGANTFILEQHGVIMSRDDWLEVRGREPGPLFTPCIKAARSALSG